MLSPRQLRGLPAIQLTRRVASSKPARIIAAALVCLVVSVWFATHLFGPQHFSGLTNPLRSGSGPVQRTGKGRLHLLVPATSGNPDLCKLLLSAQILGYPTPVLINYGAPENPDPYVQHLAKVQGLLNWLEHRDQLNRSDQVDEDLILIVDGYDVWFQLRPDILIKRFYAVNEAADRRTRQRYGHALFDRYQLRQKVLFGPDKLCWPVDFSRPACWAVPESPLPSTAFGPRVQYENRDISDPRWLNSGTIMGAAPDVRRVLDATLERIHKNHTTDSDQFYFAELFGDQEYARISRRPQLLQSMRDNQYIDHENPPHANHTRHEPELGGRDPEYHIGIDSQSSLFQTFAFWGQHLAWTRVIDSWTSPAPHNPREMRLPRDIEESMSPFELLGPAHGSHQYPGWQEVELLYNVITQEFPVLLHMTGNRREKDFRAWWWGKLWFQPEAEKLRLASNELEETPISPTSIAGLYWSNAVSGDGDGLVGKGKGGAFTDQRGWVGWHSLCQRYEAALYHAKGDQPFHPQPDAK